MKNKGISLIVLVITIIVMIILATTIILSLNSSNTIGKASEAKYKNDIAILKEKISYAENLELLGQEQDYSSLIPDSLKSHIKFYNNKELAYYADPASDEARWSREQGIIVMDEILYKTKESINELMRLAKTYVAEGKSNVSPNLLALQYIRKDRYTSSSWKMLAGEIDSNFVTYANQNKEESIVFTNINDPITGEKIDFVHAMASINVYKKDEWYMIDEYACWAGDLCTLAVQVNEYASAGEYTVDELVAYTKTLLGTKNSASSFGLEDMIADIDAVNIKNLMMENDSLEKTVYDYYIGDNIEVCKNRYSYFMDYLENTVYPEVEVQKFTEDDKIYDIVMSYTGAHRGASSGETWASVLLGYDEYQAIEFNVWKAVAISFSDYINERV